MPATHSTTDVAACAAGIAKLNGARGGSNLTNEAREGEYDCLAAQLRAVGVEPPLLGATAEDSERWAFEVEAEHVEDKPERHIDPATMLMPPGRKAWAIKDGALADVLRAAKFAAAHPAATREMAVAAAAAPQTLQTRDGQSTAGAVAVIPLCGVITPRGSLLSMLFGGGRSGLQGFREDFAEAMGNSDIGAVVLDVDSPGGLIDLVPETAAMIREARGNGKPIVAVVNTMACSAAYWLAAQADEVVCTPSGELGSIGVYMLHEDYSGMNEKIGIDPTYIKVPPYKAEGNPDEPLSDDAKATWQQDVDDLYAMFVADVAAGRNASEATVRSSYGEGRSLLAGRGVAAGLCDRIGTLEGVVGELLSAPASSVRAVTGAATDRALASAIVDELLARQAAAEERDDAEDDDEDDEQPEHDLPGDDDDLEDEDEDVPAGEPVAAPNEAAAALLFGI